MDRLTPDERARANAGYAADLWFSSSPWGLLTGLIAGCLAGFANLLGSLRR